MMQEGERPTGLLRLVIGLLFRPTATMWRLREHGSLWHSFAAATVLGGLGYGNSQWLERLTGHSQPVWASWLVGLMLSPIALSPPV